MTPQCPRPVGSAAKSSQTTYPHKIRGDSYAGEKRNGKKGKISRRKYSFPENSLTAWLKHQTSDRKAWVRCPMLPNIFQVHTEYVLVKSVGPKVLWAESRVQGTGEFFPSHSVPYLNCGGGDRWCRHLSSLRDNFYELICTVTCIVNDRRTSSPLP
ncbi:uncharacterized protein TNCV_3992021 [Trichonephila clavipes]|uniref:Uncharacterized protein n=1 Tax=Trichonephila clavipes TaxID=2585209 RepID=A0A8X6VSH5_TRICX|nr:uncharacterized protein TNCV_3992021 [Trichonephila clavipes]